MRTRVIGYDDDDNEITEELPVLRPCHRCGEPATWEQADYDEWYILCTPCGEYLGTDEYDSLQEAAFRWNERPLEDRLRQRIAELELAGVE